MKSKHTPGPWVVNGKQSIRGSNGEYIGNANWNNGAANAKLMAAAPELLETLKDVEIHLSEYVAAIGGVACRSLDQLHEVRRAIVKATGNAK